MMRKKQTLRFGIIFALLVVTFVIMGALNACTGSIAIAPKEVLRILFAGSGEGSKAADVIWKIRLPRLLAAALLGGALSVSGFLLQSFFRNPIAGPYVLGISSGAKMLVGAVIAGLITAGYKPKPDKDFTFEFRNSVEHWYPRHPSESEIKIWKDRGVDRFGNLCIIQRNVNSKFSNLPPEGKKTSYRTMIEKGSLKLRLMSALTVQGDGISASQNWKDRICEEHENEMIQMLSIACGITE